MFFKKGSKGDVTPSPSDMEMAVSVPNSAPRSETDASETNTHHNRGTVYGMQFEDGFRYQTMITYLYKRIVASGWAPANPDPEDCMGVLVRKERGVYVTMPTPINNTLLGAAVKLNLITALTMRPQMLDGILESLMPGQAEIKFADNSQLQILESLADAEPGTVKQFQYACICRQEGLILVWHDDIKNLVEQAQKIEERLLSLVWGDRSLFSILQAPTRPASPGSYMAPSSGTATPYAFEKKGPMVSAEEKLPEEELIAINRPESLERPVIRVSPVFTGLAVCLGICLLGGIFIGKLVREVMLDGNYTRLALAAVVPLLFLISLFFFNTIFAGLFQMIGPIGGAFTNSRYYSPHKPNLNKAYAEGFVPPKVSIQMPVYKEGLESVILPTIRSLQLAISYYESRGGSANIFVNDDGMRAGIPEEDVQARRDFYEDNRIGWVARPKHNGEEGYVREGKFKKASNMNFALNLSQDVERIMEEKIALIDPSTPNPVIGEKEENQIYHQALTQALEENPLAVAEGDIRVGEIILIIDSDTRVPVDCLLQGAAELFLNPEVAIIQHSTGVMQVAWDYFENGITFFTNLVYSSIRFSIGCGEVAPFVGHNAFLRWRAIQDVGVPKNEKFTCYWSEHHVSEDFDIALRLQMKGNVVRLASYHGDEFKEGVSLTIHDEIARWQKYGYGVSEMIFHPLHRWIYKGPFTKLFYTFLGSDMPWSSKLSILAYMCSYFALASALLLSLINYCIIGWFRDELSSAYLTSWNVLMSLIVVFNILGQVALALLRYRTGERSLLGSLVENFKWSPLMTCFFGGVAFHISLALLAHLFHIDMQWGATSKEKKDSNFFQEIPFLVKTYKWMYICIIIVVGGMIYLGAFAPADWRINDFTAIVPLSLNLVFHALVPLVLNPSLMVFNY
ncbi:hypothetical protein MBLNU13_g04427t1 [Cladosporium sp. NU13]